MRHSSFPAVVHVALALIALAFLHAPAQAQDTWRRVKSTGTVRVCVWPDYYGVTHRNANTQKLEGIDIDLSQEFGRDLQLKVQHVDSSFVTLVEDLLNERCDIAMFAVGMLPQRMQLLRFSKPYLQSDIYAVSTKSNRAVQRWEDIDKPGVLVGVQAGTFMEPVMKGNLKQAELMAVKLPNTREREVQSGRADVFMTDYPYSRRVLDNADWARVIPPDRPVNPVSYAYAVAPGDEAWLARIDKFVADIKRDGRLLSAAKAFKLEPIVLNQ